MYMFFCIIIFAISDKSIKKNFIILDEIQWYADSFYYFSNETIINRVQNTTNIAFYDCKFESIKDSDNGGAIYINFLTENDNQFLLKRCSFSNCFGLSGGACYIKSNYTNYININNCLFENNRCLTSGGAISVQSSEILLTECEFINNKIIIQFSLDSAKGGAISAPSSNGSLNNCYFKNNSIDFIYQIQNSIQTIYGGAIDGIDSSLELVKCIFENNSIIVIDSNSSSKYHILICGGAIYGYIIKCNKTKFIENKIFINCICNLDSYEEGGGVYLNGQSNLTNSSFINNYINSTKINIKEMKIIGGAIKCSYHIYHTIIDFLEDCLFENNYLFSCACNVTNNIEIYGAAMYLQSILNNCSFINNTIYGKISGNCNVYAKGSAIYCSYLTINCLFLKNSIYVDANESNVYINGIIYAHLFSVESYNKTITECIFENNLVSVVCNISYFYGSCVHIEHDTYLSNCIFTKNSAFFYGNSAFVSGGVLSYRYRPNKVNYNLSKCNFIDNKFNFFMQNYNIKGEILYYECGIINIDNCLFECSSNNNSYSKAIIFVNTFTNTFFQQSFTNNKIIINSPNTVVFNCTELKLNSYFDNNCILPYDQNLFKTDNSILCNELDNHEISFIEAFEDKCEIKSFEFTKSTEFSQTNEYTQSFEFSNSLYFSESLIFTLSTEFTQSDIFSKSNVFIRPSEFTQSDKFTPSNIFSVDDNLFTNITPTQSQKDVTLIKSISQTNVKVRTVIFTISCFLSNTIYFTYNEEKDTYVFSITNLYYSNRIPYIIYSLSPSYIQIYFELQLSNSNKISPEKLIGIVCGAFAVFFIVLGIIILVIYKRNNTKEFLEDYSETIESSSSELKTNNGINMTITTENIDNWI